VGLPRCIHFIWLDEEIPSNRQACLDSFTEHHPDWTLQVWRSLEDFGPLRNQAIFDAADELAAIAGPKGNPHQFRSDVLRYEILLRHGGIYSDLDVTCLRSFEPLAVEMEQTDKAGLLAWEVQNRWLGQAVIFSQPQARWLQRVVEGLERSARRHRGAAATVICGPQYLTRLLVHRKAPEREELLVMDRDTFYPVWCDDPRRADAVADGREPAPASTYAVHRWANQHRRRGMAW
jgi:mannosyltransferase OCH1-like enzyme